MEDFSKKFVGSLTNFSEAVRQKVFFEESIYALQVFFVFKNVFIDISMFQEYLLFISRLQGSAAAPQPRIRLKLKPECVQKNRKWWIVFLGNVLDNQLNYKIIVCRFHWGLHAADARLPSPAHLHFSFSYINKEALQTNKIESSKRRMTTSKH